MPKPGGKFPGRDLEKDDAKKPSSKGGKSDKGGKKGAK